jgi:polyhydroxybutyrate depolymerase
VEALSLPRHATGARGYLLVVPEGASDGEGKSFWNASAACCGVGANRPDDVRYLKAVLDDVKRHFAIDSERVFAIGASNGGFMAHRWACDSRSDLRGIVSISGAGQGPDDPPCAPARPLSVLEIHGTEDRTIRIEGGQGANGRRYPSASETVAAWCKVADLRGDPAQSESYVFRLGTLRKTEWTGPRVKVALWTVEQGDHELRGVRGLTTELIDFLEGS